MSWIVLVFFSNLKIQEDVFKPVFKLIIENQVTTEKNNEHMAALINIRYFLIKDLQQYVCMFLANLKCPHCAKFCVSEMEKYPTLNV